MTNERFNKLINGPLAHPMVGFNITRLVLALRHVVEATGEAGEKALEEHCAARAAKDRDDSIAFREDPWYQEDRPICDECLHPLDRHGPEGCEVERIAQIEGSSETQSGPCGCKGEKR